MSTDVTVFDPTCLGAAEEVSAKDIQIGRLAVMSASSNLVKEEQAKQGEIVDLDTLKVMGYKEEKPLELVVLKSFRYWVEKEGDEFIAKYPATDPNEKPWEEGNIKRMYHHSFYVLVPSEIEEGIELPYEIAFRSSELNSAKKLSKMLLTMRRRGAASWNQSFTVTTEVKKKGQFSWYGTNIKPGAETSEKVRMAAYSWYKTISDPNVKIKVADEVDTSGEQAF